MKIETLDKLSSKEELELTKLKNQSELSNQEKDKKLFLEIRDVFWNAEC